MEDALLIQFPGTPEAEIMQAIQAVYRNGWTHRGQEKPSPVPTKTVLGLEGLIVTAPTASESALSINGVQVLRNSEPTGATPGKPVRLQRLRLRNNSSRQRKLTVTAYATLVLGSDPEETGMHIVTKWDLQSQTLFARNSYNPEFCVCVTANRKNIRK